MVQVSYNDSLFSFCDTRSTPSKALLYSVPASIEFKNSNHRMNEHFPASAYGETEDQTNANILKRRVKFFSFTSYFLAHVNILHERND